MSEPKLVISPRGKAGTGKKQQQQQRRKQQQSQSQHQQQEKYARILSQQSSNADVKREVHSLSARYSTESPSASAFILQQVFTSPNDDPLDQNIMFVKTETSRRHIIENKAFMEYHSLMEEFRKCFPGGWLGSSQISSARGSDGSSWHRRSQQNTTRTIESSVSTRFDREEGFDHEEQRAEGGRGTGSGSGSGGGVVVPVRVREDNGDNNNNNNNNNHHHHHNHNQGMIRSHHAGAVGKGDTDVSKNYPLRKSEEEQREQQQQLREQRHSLEVQRGLPGFVESYGTMVFPQDKTVGLLNGISRNETLQWPSLIADLMSGAREGSVTCSLYQDELPVFKGNSISDDDSSPHNTVEVGAEEVVKTGFLLLPIWLTSVMRQMLFSTFTASIMALLLLQGTFFAAVGNVANINTPLAKENYMKPFLFLVNAMAFFIVLIPFVVICLLFFNNDSRNAHFLPHIMLLSGLSLAIGGSLCVMFGFFRVSLWLLFVGHIIHGVSLAISFLALLLFAVVEQAFIAGTLLLVSLGYCTWLFSNAVGLFLFSTILHYSSNGITIAVSLLVGAMFVNLCLGFGVCVLVPPETCLKATRTPRYFLSARSGVVKAIQSISLYYLLRCMACGSLFAVGILFTVMAGESSLQLSALRQYTVDSPSIGPYIISLLFLSGLFFFPLSFLPRAGCFVRIAESGLCSVMMLLVLLAAFFNTQLRNNTVVFVHISPFVIIILVMFLSGLSLSVSVAGVLRSLCMLTMALPAVVSAWLFTVLLTLCTILALGISTLPLCLIQQPREEEGGNGKEFNSVTCVILGMSVLTVFLQLIPSLWRRLTL
ncbi:hypothetical protein LSM04_002372 [Trypanosoma melophagium]|uniref:uncharacterized protein n=1 Tax=Trypanosoma melophagium TaxID=715481 RepID=UPI00351A616F|nr:hypothetical protein LSM04_002372 [Trypanosoma melophagium]